MKPAQVTIASLMGLTQEQYAELIYEHGMDWLNYYHRGNQAAIDLFSGSAHFWCAWKEQFEAVDFDLFDGLKAETMAMLIDKPQYRKEFKDSWLAAHRIEAVRECPDRATLRLMSEELRDAITHNYHNDNTR